MRFDILQRFIDILRGKYPVLYTAHGKTKYDEICSLGYNCEVSMRINNLLLKECNHYIFTYSYEHNRELFLNALDNLTQIYKSPFSLSGKMLLAEKYQISFHPRKESKLINTNGSINQQILNECKEELKSRIKYLGEKTVKLLNSDKNILLVLKIKPTDYTHDKKFITDIYNTLIHQFPSGKFTLLCVLARNTYSPTDINKFYELEQQFNKKNSSLKFGIIKYFADDLNTIKGGDISGWLNILGKEYYKFYFAIPNPLFYMIRLFKNH